MDVIGTTTGRMYHAGRLLARAGEGGVFLVDGDPTVLVKVFDRPLTPRDVEKLLALAAVRPTPAHTALPLEVIQTVPAGTPVGYVQPYFSQAVPLTRALDPAGRAALGLSDDLAFRVRLCRLLAEAFERVHAASLVVGDVSDGNFLLDRGWLGRITRVISIDCNSFQVTRRTAKGNEFFASGVATEEYAAPEVQPTDWATSPRSVHSDSFGFAVLAWKLLFNGAHPFAVVTPRSVDVPPLGRRIEQRLFPWQPGTPLPPGWVPPAVQPPLAVLPPNIREHLFRTFSADDPRDRASAEEWVREFRAWERSLDRGLPLRLLGRWAGSGSGWRARLVAAVKPTPGRLIALAVLIALTTVSLRPAGTTSPPPKPLLSSPGGGGLPQTDAPRTRPTRPRTVDRGLFPDPIWQPAPQKE